MEKFIENINEIFFGDSSYCHWLAHISKLHPSSIILFTIWCNNWKIHFKEMTEPFSVTAHIVICWHTCQNFIHHPYPIYNMMYQWENSFLRNGWTFFSDSSYCETLAHMSKLHSYAMYSMMYDIKLESPFKTKRKSMCETFTVAAHFWPTIICLQSHPNAMQKLQVWSTLWNLLCVYYQLLDIDITWPPFSILIRL